MSSRIKATHQEPKCELDPRVARTCMSIRKAMNHRQLKRAIAANIRISDRLARETKKEGK